MKSNYKLLYSNLKNIRDNLDNLDLCEADTCENCNLKGYYILGCRIKEIKNYAGNILGDLEKFINNKKEVKNGK